MTEGSHGRRGAVLAALIVVALLLLVGCSAAGSSAGSPGSVRLIKVDAPLREPLWVPHKEYLLALSGEGSKVVRVDTGAAVRSAKAPGPRGVVRSGNLKDVGENMAFNSGKTDELFVPQPKLGRVALLDTDTLKKLRSIKAGKKPEWVATHPVSNTLLAISKDGSTVTGVSTKSYEKAFSTRVDAGKEGRVYAAENNLNPAFWVVRSDRVTHYIGGPPERTVGRRIKVNSEAFAPDPEHAQRAYVGDTSGRVVLLDGDPRDELEGRLVVSEERKVDGKPEYIENRAAEDLAIYVATESKLYIMDPETLEVLHAIDFRRPLEQRSLKEAKLSGMAVGEKNIYLTLEGEPYVVSIRKPS